MSLKIKKQLVSVIIPAHNSAGTIDVAIKSMLSQTYDNIEVIVVDDNSADNTEKVVRNIKKTDQRLKYFSLPFNDPQRFNKRGRNINAGYMARNYGLEKANGEWITFQDADDASLLNRIEVQYDLAKKYNATHLCIDWQQLKPSLLEKKLNVKQITEDQPDIITTPSEISALAKKNKGIIIPILGKLNRRIPFEWKRLPVINKLFFGSLAPYPGCAGVPFLKREVIAKVRFRKLSDRVWPSFTGRGADRDFNFQVAETFQNSISFKFPLYLYRVDRQNKNYIDYEKYATN